MFRNILTLALLVSTSIASQLVARDIISADTIIQDVKNIDKGVNHLRAGNAAYEGGLLEQTPLLASFTEIHLANRKGFADAGLRATDYKYVHRVQRTVHASAVAALHSWI